MGKVLRYAVFEPRAWAGAMIELSNWVIPMEARTFRMRELPEANCWVGSCAPEVGLRSA